MSDSEKDLLHISELEDGYQVRIIRRGKIISKYFSHTLYGDESKSLDAAIAWRDKVLTDLRCYQIRYLKLPKHKKSTGVTGVNRCIKYNKNVDRYYLVYTVFWVKYGKQTNKSFQVGNIDDISVDEELHAFRTACLFRYYYEYCIDQDLHVDVSLFWDWKNKRLYDDENFWL